MMSTKEGSPRYSLHTLLSLCPVSHELFLHAKKPAKSKIRAAAVPSVHDPREAASGTAPRYSTYVSLREALAGVACGKYHVGVLRVAKGRRDDAFISNENSDEPDYLVQGRLNRNRAVHRDTVVFEVLSKDLWCAAQHTYSSFYPSEDDEMETPQEIQLTKRLHPTVRVVHVLDFDGKDRSYIAVLRENKAVDVRNKETASCDQSKSATFSVQLSDRYVKAIPFDKRIPWILIPVTDLAQWVKIPGEIHEKSLFKVQMTSWDCHNSLPLGCVKGLGDNLDEFEAIEKIMMEESCLASHMNDFSESVKKEVDKILADYHKTFDYQVTQRRDFRQRDIRVFTIDPRSAQDLDDAIHIRSKVSEYPPEFEIGVHIADVSHFVLPHNPIDLEASNRTTTIYLPRRSFPMLPRELCNNLCSLNPYEDKLTFSVVFVVDSKGNLLENKPVWFGHSVIRSVARFSYDEVQKVLDHFSRLQKEAPASQNPLERWAAMESVRPETCHQEIWPEIWSDLVLLESVTQKMRQRRSNEGCLTLHTCRLFFDFNRYLLSNQLEDNVEQFISFSADIDNRPIDEATRSAHYLIEELMLMTNRLVAKKLYNSILRDYTILRHHPKPKTFEFAQFLKFINHFQLQTLPDSTSLHKILHKLQSDHGLFIQLSIEHLFMKCLFCANYIVPEKNSQHSHFALCFDLYTHFTSPIRRYADLVVHRLLHALLFLEKNNKNLCDSYELCESPRWKESITAWMQETLRKTGIHLDIRQFRSQCDFWNTKRLQAREVSEECSLQFFLLSITRRQKCIPTLGSLISLQERRLNVFLPLLSTASFLHFQQFEVNDETKKNGLEHNKRFPQNFLNDYCPPRRITQDRYAVSIVWDVPKQFLKDSGTTFTSLDHSPYLFSTETIEQRVMILGPFPLYIVPLDTMPRTFTILPIPPWCRDFSCVLFSPQWLIEQKRKELYNALIESTKTGRLNLGGFQPKQVNETLPQRLDHQDTSKISQDTTISTPPGKPDVKSNLVSPPLKSKEVPPVMSYRGGQRGRPRSRRRSKHVESLRATERIIQFNIAQRSEKANPRRHPNKNPFPQDG